MLDCQCSPAYSNGSVCQVYGGQCPCIEDGGQVGRQCDICLFSYYLNDTLGRCIVSCDIIHLRIFVKFRIKLFLRYQRYIKVKVT